MACAAPSSAWARELSPREMFSDRGRRRGGEPHASSVVWGWGARSLLHLFSVTHQKLRRSAHACLHSLHMHVIPSSIYLCGGKFLANSCRNYQDLYPWLRDDDLLFYSCAQILASTQRNPKRAPPNKWLVAVLVSCRWPSGCSCMRSSALMRGAMVAKHVRLSRCRVPSSAPQATHSVRLSSTMSRGGPHRAWRRRIPFQR